MKRERKRWQRKKTKTGRVSKITHTLAESSGDLVTIQIVARFKKVPKGLKITKKLLQSFIRHKAATSRGYWDGQSAVGCVEGDNPKGVELNIIRWRNPSRKKGPSRWGGGSEWRSGPQSEAWGTLRRVLETIRL